MQILDEWFRVRLVALWAHSPDNGGILEFAHCADTLQKGQLFSIVNQLSSALGMPRKTENWLPGDSTKSGFSE